MEENQNNTITLNFKMVMKTFPNSPLLQRPIGHLAENSKTSCDIRQFFPGLFENASVIFFCTSDSTNIVLSRTKYMFRLQQAWQLQSKHGRCVQFLNFTPPSHIKSSSLCAKLFGFDIAIIKILIDFFSHLVYGRYMYLFCLL